MGNLPSLSSLFAETDAKVLMLGLDAAGKTTIMYKVKTGDTITTVPTIGFNVEEIKYEGFVLTVWDIGGQDKVRSLWHHYYSANDLLIFVVDSADRDRLPMVKREIENLWNQEDLASNPLLVYANKQDLSRAMRPRELEDYLDLFRMSKGRKYHVQGCVATTSTDELLAGLQWAAGALRETKRKVFQLPASCSLM